MDSLHHQKTQQLVKVWTQNRAETNKKNISIRKKMVQKSKRGLKQHSSTNLAKPMLTFGNSQPKTKLLEERLHKVLSNVFG
jgi:hypothetical protein